MRFIEHIVDPTKLLLSWQPPDRGRYIVAELHRKGDDADLVYLRNSEEYANAMKKGFDGDYPGFPKDQDVHPNALAVFMRRLPPRGRTDFNKFLEAIRIQPGTSISDFTLLGYAGAKLPGDDFFIIHPFDKAEPPFEFLLLVAGHRHYQKDVPCDKIEIDMSARFELEPDNLTDPNAVKIVIPDVAEATAGYVSRGLLPQFRRWLEEGLNLQATVERKNGASDHPLVYLFVKVG